MSQVGAPQRRSPRSRTPRSRTLRSVATLTTAALAVTVLAGCSSDEDADTGPAAAQDNAPTARALVDDGGTLRWAVDALPATFNVFQADADSATSRVAGAVLPALHTLDERGRPRLNPDYLETAEVIETEPRQVVLYKLNQQAVWSDGREIGAADFVAQWRALSGRDTAYWTARNAGYERIEKIEKGKNDLEVRVTFAKPYADWRALFTPLYPKQVMGSPNSFNDGARTTLKATAGPFLLGAADRKTGDLTLTRNPRWWGKPAKLDSLVLRAVPRADREAALAGGKLDLAEIDRSTAERIALALKDADAGRGGAEAARLHGPGSSITPGKALRSWALAHGEDEELAAEVTAARAQNEAAVARYAAAQDALAGYVVRKSLEPAYTQLSLNGESGPLADERVRRAVARAIDRRELAESVLKPLGLPSEPPGSHLALAGQAAYADSSDALGDQDTKEARALLADAGWVPGGAQKKPAGTKAGAGAEKTTEKTTEKATEKATEKKAAGTAEEADSKKKAEQSDTASDDGLYIVGDDKPGELPAAPRIGPGGPETGTRVLAPAPAAARESAALLARAEALDTGTRAAAAAPANAKPDRGVAGAYAPMGSAAPAAAPAASQALGKDGKALSLRFVLPSGPGSETLRAVGDRIVRMLDAVGIRTEITKVSDESFFKDHVASGEYDLALYSWPASAYPATDARPIFAKPEPASDGSLLVEQNYSRVGTDRIDQLFDQAAGTLDEEEAGDLIRQADARIWAAAGSIPLYQRPQLVAARKDVVNAGAWGFAAPRYQDIGFKKSETTKGSPSKR
ncbi:ABC transporter family substrate-binding protein [Streptomyces sp. R302]|uniref:ABC transporter family substrate-binding protein n=1 Tax=unclassified Streptomyces TaxID=2593676 RepID=UPI00145E35F4|nr:MULTISPECIES: ABC transporter family substrate-binding protein [unclassified Streptomyces]NML52860.1 ABC transporter family substrate-binding protein [Streptomyces sp. R301]NML78695.1 ABC transporter family substrate-binding protein [Streptomyces sp. R302]